VGHVELLTHNFAARSDYVGRDRSCDADKAMLDELGDLSWGNHQPSVPGTGLDVWSFRSRPVVRVIAADVVARSSKPRFRICWPWGDSGCGSVFVDETAARCSSLDRVAWPDRGDDVDVVGCALIDLSVWAVLVVVIDVLEVQSLQLAFVPDDGAVE
jgi:hypothetical protein